MEMNRNFLELTVTIVDESEYNLLVFEKDNQIGFTILVQYSDLEKAITVTGVHNTTENQLHDIYFDFALEMAFLIVQYEVFSADSTDDELVFTMEELFESIPAETFHSHSAMVIQQAVKLLFYREWAKQYPELDFRDWLNDYYRSHAVTLYRVAAQKPDGEAVIHLMTSNPQYIPKDAKNWCEEVGYKLLMYMKAD